jgi:serine/threonine-protein kinase
MALVLQPGDVYAGNIKILRVLGSGAFASVYNVEVRGYDKPLALKLTREPATSGEQAQRALREITILRSLTNPHVVRTFDCGLRPDGHVYMLMDYLEGQTLNTWHKFDQPLHPAQAVTIVHQACLGLAEPHAQGIVHRDVKPENIFVQDNGQIKVLDFGLARSWDGKSVIGMNATQIHMVVGTPCACRGAAPPTASTTGCVAVVFASRAGSASATGRAAAPASPRAPSIRRASRPCTG